MSTQIYSIDKQSKSINLLKRTSAVSLGFQEVRDLETWLASCGDRLFNRAILWLARQDWPADNQRSDLIGLTDEGDLVVVELKRGRALPDAVTQVLAYAAEYQSKTADQLAEIYHIQSQKDGQIALIKRACSLNDANDKIAEHVSEKEINQSQICLVMAEEFDDKILAICDYLENSSGESTFSIELWQYGIYERGSDCSESDYFFLLEQVAPPPTVRERVEAEREAAKSRKWARDPGRLQFMARLVQFLSDKRYPLQRSRGETYAGAIEVKEREIIFQFRRGDQHPWLRIPNELTLPDDAQRELGGPNLKSEAAGDHWWIEFSDVDTANLEFEQAFGERLMTVLDKLEVAPESA